LGRNGHPSLGVLQRRVDPRLDFFTQGNHLGVLNFFIRKHVFSGGRFDQGQGGAVIEAEFRQPGFGFFLSRRVKTKRAILQEISACHRLLQGHF
jgi:hypothetical protein